MNSILLKPVSDGCAERRAEAASLPVLPAEAEAQNENQTEKDRQEPLVCFCVEKDAYQIRARQRGRFVLSGGDACALFSADSLLRLHNGKKTSVAVQENEELLLRFAEDKASPVFPEISLVSAADAWISAKLSQRGEKDVISFSVAGKKNAFFSLGVSVGRYERVLCGRFDENGRARLSLTVPMADKKRWTLERPALYEVSAELLEDCSGRKRRCFSLGMVAYERRKEKNGHALYKDGTSLRLLGLFAEPPFSVSVSKMKASGVSLLACPATLVNETLLAECDTIGMGVAACITVARDASPASLSLLAEELFILKKSHPSLLYLMLLYGSGASKSEGTLKKAIDALLAHYGSQVGILHLKKNEEADFYTDLPFVLSEKRAEVRFKEKYGWDEATFRAWLYRGLASAFFASDARYLFLPACLQSAQGLSLLEEARKIGFQESVFFVPCGREAVLPLRIEASLTGATVHCLLEREGKTVAEGGDTLSGEPVSVRFGFPKTKKTVAYTLFASACLDGCPYRAEATVISFPKEMEAKTTFLDKLPLGECRLGEAGVVTREENSFLLFSKGEDLPPLISFSSPLATLSFDSDGLVPLLENERGGSVAARAPDGSFTVDGLILDKKSTKTDGNGEENRGKNDFFENFF